MPRRAGLTAGAECGHVTRPRRPGQIVPMAKTAWSGERVIIVH